eukprot:128987_1
MSDFVFIEESSYIKFDHSIPTIYGLYPRALKHINLNDESAFIPLQVRGFELRGKQKYIRMDIRTREGRKWDQLIKFENAMLDDWADACVDNEEWLTNHGFITTKSFQQMLIKERSSIYQHIAGDQVQYSPMYCKAKFTIQGTIQKVSMPKYWNQMTPPYLFKADDPTKQQYNGWIYEAQITSTYKEISIQDIVISKLRRAVNNGQQFNSDYLAETELPVDLLKNNAFYGKEKLFNRFKDMAWDDVAILWTYLERAVQLAFLKVDDTQTTPKIVRAHGSQTQMVYLDEPRVNCLLNILSSRNIAIKSSQNKMEFSIDLETLGINNVISCGDDGSEIRLQNQNIDFVYHRTKSSFYVSRLGYYFVSAEAVKAQKKCEMKLDE